MGDVVEPLGAQFKTPSAALGSTIPSSLSAKWSFARATKAGIAFKRGLSTRGQVTSQSLRGARQEAWDSLRRRLTPAVSIGFRPLGIRPLGNGGLRFTFWEWLEPSVVTVPAAPAALITTAKSASRPSAGRVSVRLTSDDRLAGQIAAHAEQRRRAGERPHVAYLTDAARQEAERLRMGRGQSNRRDRGP